MSEYTLTGDKSVEAAVSEICESPMNGTVVVSIKKKTNTRTAKQNNSLHLWCGQMADALNESGQHMQVVGFKQDFKVPWTMGAIKSIFQRVADAMYEQPKTHLLTTNQLQKVYEAVNLRFAEISGVSICFPSDEPPMAKERV